MKRKISLLLLILFVFTLSSPVLTVSAVSEEDQRLSRNELVDLACRTFPEYSMKITTFPVNSTARSVSGDRTVVHSETRDISANETITYTEFSDGLTSILYNKKWYEITSTQSGTITTVRGDLSCMCNLSLEELYVADFIYCINSNGYDYISSYGTDIMSDCDIFATYRNQYENANANAFLEYRVLFAPYPYLEEMGFASHSAIIRFDIGNNTFTTTVNGS